MPASKDNHTGTANTDNNDEDDGVNQVNGGDPSYMRDVTATQTPYVHDHAEPDLLKQIESLKAALHVKEEQMLDLQQGLQAQVQMVMELEALEQTEVADYQAKLDANRRLIDELGDRVGANAKDKAELETKLKFAELKVVDQAEHIARLEQVHQTHVQILQQINATAPPSASDNNTKQHQQQQQAPPNSVWQVYTKVEDLMQTNHDMTLALQTAQQAKYDLQQQVQDKELLCLELSSQLDKLAVQLNQEDELMANVQRQLQDKTKECKTAQERVAFLEQAWAECQPDETNNDDNNELPPSSSAVLFQTLRETELKLAQTTKTRDAALAKASKLSVALAKSRETCDWLQGKVDYQNGMVEKILGKGAMDKALAKRNNHNTTTTTTATTPRNTPSGTTTAPFDGSRIRTLWKTATGTPTTSGSGSKASPTAATASKSHTNASPTTNGTTTTTTTNNDAPGLRSKIGQLGELVRRSKPLRALSSGTKSSSPRNSATTSATTVDNDKPISVHELSSTSEHQPVPINSTVGQPTELEENVQGGGGDVSQALTL